MFHVLSVYVAYWSRMKVKTFQGTTKLKELERTTIKELEKKDLSRRLHEIKVAMDARDRPESRRGSLATWALRRTSTFKSPIERVTEPPV